MAAIHDHIARLSADPRYKELITAVEAKAKELDGAYDLLLKEYPLTEPDVIYCVFGDGKCRPTYTQPPDRD